MSKNWGHTTSCKQKAFHISLVQGQRRIHVVHVKKLGADERIHNENEGLNIPPCCLNLFNPCNSNISQNIIEWNQDILPRMSMHVCRNKKHFVTWRPGFSRPQNLWWTFNIFQIPSRFEKIWSLKFDRYPLLKAGVAEVTVWCRWRMYYIVS